MYSGFFSDARLVTFDRKVLGDLGQSFQAKFDKESLENILSFSTVLA